MNQFIKTQNNFFLNQRSVSSAQNSTKAFFHSSNDFYEIDDSPFHMKKNCIFPRSEESSPVSSPAKMFKRQILINSNQNFGSSLILEQPPSVLGITEEGLDDWIAQSSNRPISSYLNPLRRFGAPAQLITEMKKRYSKSPLRTREGNFNQFYFCQNDEKIIKSRRNRLSSSLNRSPFQKNQNLLFDSQKLLPKKIRGTSIKFRENKINKSSSITPISFLYGEKEPMAVDQSTKPLKEDKQASKLSQPQDQLIQSNDSINSISVENNDNIKQYNKSQIQTLRNLSTRFSRQNQANFSFYDKSLDQIKKKQLANNKQINFSIKQGEIKQNISIQQGLPCNQSQESVLLLQSEEDGLNNSQFSIKKQIASPIFKASIKQKEGIDSKQSKKERSKNHQFEKEFSKRIAEKVEKLLSEREEKFFSEKEVKQIPTWGITNSEKEEDNNFEQYFTQHLIEISEIPKSRGTQESAVTAFIKGVGRMKKKKDKSAISAFKQALNFDKAYFEAIYNIACLYERNQKFKIGEQWLDIANIFQKNKINISYGYSLIYYKTQRFEEAFKKINAVIQELEQNEEREEIPLNFIYLRALCSKRLAQQMIAESDFKYEENILNRLPTFEEKSSHLQIQQCHRDSTRIKQIKDIKTNRNEEQSEDRFENEESFEGKPRKKVNERVNTIKQSEKASVQYYSQAANDYKTLSKSICPNDFKLFKDLMFAVVFKKIRKMEIKFPPYILCEFLSLVNQIIASETYLPVFEQFIPSNVSERNMISTSFFPPKKRQVLEFFPSQIQIITPSSSLDKIYLNSLSRKKEDIIQRLSKLSFFKRFNPMLLEKFLPSFKLRYVEKGEILFAQKGEVLIITGGHLRVHDHSKKYDRPDIVAYYSEGDIIGCDDKDNKLSFRPEIWFVCLTKVEFLEMNENEFQELWSHQNNNKQKQVLNFLKSIDIFENVSELTLYLLAFELLVEKFFNYKDVVYNDGESVNKYSYIQLVKDDPKALRNLCNRITNKIEILPLTYQLIPGMYFVQEGSLQLVTLSNWHQYSLQQFNFIGENLLTSSLSITRFGKIECSSPSTKCLFLNRSFFHKINSLDRSVMKANQENSEYYSNCQKILYKYYRFFKIEDFDQDIKQNQSMI